MAKDDLIARQRGFVGPGVQTTTRPISGGRVVVPAPGGAVDVFQGSAEQLTAIERSQPGWCVRMATSTLELNEDAETTGGYRMNALSLEVLSTSGGLQTSIEVDVYPWTQIYVPSDTLQLRLKHAAQASPLHQPPATLHAHWSVVRGFCATHAVRSVHVAEDFLYQADLPRYARSFMMQMPDQSNLVEPDIWWTIELRETWGGRVLQAFSQTDLFYNVNSFVPLAPGAGNLRLMNQDQAGRGDLPELRLVYNFGEIVQP